MVRWEHFFMVRLLILKLIWSVGLSSKTEKQWNWWNHLIKRIIYGSMQTKYWKVIIFYSFPPPATWHFLCIWAIPQSGKWDFIKKIFSWHIQFTGYCRMKDNKEEWEWHPPRSRAIIVSMLFLTWDTLEKKPSGLHCVILLLVWPF